MIVIQRPRAALSRLIFKTANRVVKFSSQIAIQREPPMVSKVQLLRCLPTQGKNWHTRMPS